MKPFPLVLAVAILITASCNWSTGPAPDATTALPSPNQVRCREMFVQLFPADGYLHVKEYHLESLRAADEVAAQAAAIRAAIANVQYAASEYQFTLFESREEQWFPDRDFVTGEYHLQTNETGLPNLINDSFAKLLRRPVTLKVNESEIILQFEATGLRVADNNAQGVFLHRETNWLRLVFPNGQRSLDAVFTFLHDGEDDAISLAPYFEDAVHGERNADP